MLSVIRLLITVILFVLLSISASAQWERDGEILLDYAPYVGTPRILPDEDNGALAFWVDTRMGMAIWGQKIDSAGYQLWGEGGTFIGWMTGSYSDYWAFSDGHGGGVIAWNSYRGRTSNIYAQRINLSGELLWGDTGIVITDWPGNEWGVYAISDNSDGAILAWVGDEQGIARIVAQRLSPEGEKMFGDGIILADEYEAQWRPKLTMTSDGNIACIWLDSRTSGHGTGIYAQKFDMAGNLLWDSLGVAIAYDSVDIDFLLDFHKVAPDNLGGFYCVFISHQVCVQHVTGEGTIAFSPSGIEISSGRYIFDPYIVIGESQEAIVCWENDSDNYIGLNIVDSLGNQQWPGGTSVIGDVITLGGLASAIPGEFEIAVRVMTPPRLRMQRFNSDGELFFDDGGVDFGDLGFVTGLWVTTDSLGGIIPISRYGNELKIHRVYRDGHVGGDTTTYVAENPLPGDYRLSLDNYPNPFNSGTLITINSPISQNVNLNLFDILGRKILSFPSTKIESGATTFYLDLSADQAFSSGTYFLVLKASNYVLGRKLVHLK